MGSPILLSWQSGWCGLHCARRTSTFLSCAFREQEDYQAAPPPPASSVMPARNLYNPAPAPDAQTARYNLVNTLTTPPSRIRWLILALLFLISVVTYIDRVNISVTARQMMPAYGMTDQQMGWVFSAFVVGYALFQIPGGWLADRWGVRAVLTVALLWWSICTAFTAIAAVSSFVSLVGIVGALMLVRVCRSEEH